MGPPNSGNYQELENDNEQLLVKKNNEKDDRVQEKTLTKNPPDTKNNANQLGDKKFRFNVRGCIAAFTNQIVNTEAKDMNPRRCMGFQVFPPSTFYPISYRQWWRYFSETDANETMQFINQARAIHVWNRFSASQPVLVDSKVPYAVVARQYCPRIFTSCGLSF
ncbi:hypothetical protein QAD02_013906 [Eretmocerus hayati]|uniref:Uncharacterized protein n=1 Tax=Eretmocerus hayati TaxID=131215 RepID=A0ACC2P480_9HYME|nr:hypothetical protein QAD02_013906 [Eretmocerus hayati]